ncbi:CAP domain-containing protein [Virgibacillus sp. DJP39]|uniref:CAP domain-containing protein n=1 Tax=Virgibacillus sp. DJP39 TaxID=3409790 RepID=UPI003BB66A1B
MRLIRSIIILSLLVLIGYYLLEVNNEPQDYSVQESSLKLENRTSLLETKLVPKREKPTRKFGNELFQWIGKDIKQLSESFGEPVRKDLSAYGYEWWVYTNNEQKYIQFGVLDNKVITIYVTGKDLYANQLYAGQPYQEVNKQFSFKDKVSMSQGISTYTFKLNNEEMQMRPLVKVAENVFVQYYFDTFTSKLSAVRVSTGEVLLKQRPYSIEYRGKLPAKSNLSDEEWNKIESGMEQQIFSITNIIRSQFDKSSLNWGESVSKVAFLHSKDMAENNYFSHYGLNGDGLKERLAAQKVYYLSAGENIAAQYPDAPAAVQGWLNSEGHRKALLESDYTHLGVGVYHFYYTQNFLQK